MGDHFQGIFRLQNVNKDPDRIKDFLLSDIDDAPYEELLNKRLSKELKSNLEDFLAQLELEDSLLNDINQTLHLGYMVSQ